MNTSIDELQIRSRMGTARNIIGIISLVGWIYVIIEIFVEGFSAAQFVWILAFLSGSIFWYSTRVFIDKPDDGTTRNLQVILPAFIITWIAAALISYLVWGEFYIATGIGIMVCLVATYFMNQLISDGKLLLTIHDSKNQTGQED